MNTSNNQRYDTSVYNSLNLKDTEELVKIWQENDQAAWTPEAFAAIKDILLVRLGKLPEQESTKTYVEVNTYHDPERLEKIAGWAHTLSWILLFLFIAKPIVEICWLWVDSNTSNQLLSNFFANIIFSGNRSILSEFFIGAVYFVVLQALSEGIYLFMDIEDNTRSHLSSS